MEKRDKNTSTGVDLYEELSKLNNELTNMQRELAKKNAALEKANAENLRLLREDPLTKIANRRHFLERFEALSALSKRHSRPLTILMFDLDNFKSVNDTYGHDAGDAVLKVFANLLKKSTRLEDMPARFGGEEFVLMFPETDTESAFFAAERLRRKFSQIDILDNGTNVTVSIGLAALEAGDTWDTLMKKADTALYTSKEAGRNRTTIWNATQSDR